MKNNYIQSKNRLRYSFSKLILTCIALITFGFGANAQTVLINPATDGGFQIGTGSFIDNGWTVVNASTNTWNTGTVPAWFTGIGGAYISNTAGTSWTFTNSTTQASHFYKDIAFPAGETNITLTFDWRGNGNDTDWDNLLVYITDVAVTPTTASPTGTSSTPSWAGYTNATTGYFLLQRNGTVVPTSTTQVNYTFSAAQGTYAAGNTKRIIFTWKNDGSGGANPPASVDNISLTSSCSGPGTIAATSVTATSATMNWNTLASATGYNLRYRIVGSSTWINDPSNPYVGTTATVSSLTSSSIYEYQVAATGPVCSAYGSITNFTTLCGVTSTPMASAQNFSTYLPLCWTEATGTLAATTTLTGTSSNWDQLEFGNNLANSLSANINIWSTGRDEWLISPSIDLGTGGDKQLVFNLALTDFGTENLTNLGSDDKFAVVISTDNGVTWSNANTLRLWNSTTPISNIGEEVIINLSAYTGVVKFGLYGESTVSNADNDLFVDDFQVANIPACPKPNALAIYNPTATTAIASWTNGGSETLWEAEYGVAPYTFSGNPMATFTSNPFTITGLTQLTTYNIKIRANCGGTFSDWSTSRTFVTLPTCPTPTAFAVSNITATSAALSWTNGGSETNWDIEYGVSPYTFTGTPITSTTVNPYSLTSLTPNTTYQVKIRANCGGGDNSPWSVTRTFTTPCGTFPTPTVIAEDFETYLPGCWTEANGTLAATTTLTGTGSDWQQVEYLNDVANGQAARLNVWSTGLFDWLISPSYDLGTGGGKQLVFNIALTDYGSGAATTLGADDKIAVVISTNNGATWSNANTLMSWNSSSTISNTGEEITIDLSAYSGLVKFGFYGESTASNADNDLFIDDFEITTIPTCVKPTNINLTAITTNSATLNWTAPTSSTPVNYQWEVRSSGMPGSGATGLVTSGSVASSAVTANITGLSASTTYLVYLRSDCGAGDFSEWTNGTSLSTVCGIISSFPFTEDFEAESAPTLPNCWSQNNNNSDFSQWGTGTTSVGSLKCAVIDTDGNGGANDDYLILPQFNLAGNLRLGFSVATRSSFEPNDFRVVLSSTGNAPADFTTELMSLTSVNATSFTAITPINLSAYSGNTYIAIHVPSGGLDGWELYVDDIEIIELNNDATLSSITPSDIGTYTPMLEPTFVSSITNYTVNLPFNPYSTLPGTSADVTATATNSGASVVITNAVDATTGTAPDNVATIVVTSSDGTTTSTYTVTYQVAPPSNDASLSNLIPSVGNLSTTFVSTNTSYDVTLILGSTGTAGASSFVTSHPYATVSVVDASDVTGTIANANICVVTVTAEDGTTQQQYYINYYVATSLNSNANLSSITPSSGTLSPTFVASITNYTVSLPVGTTGATTTTVVTSDFYATYTVTNATNVAGTSPANVATIIVTAQDGTMQTYTVTYNVTPPSSDATLASLTTSQGTLDPAFSPGTLTYAVHLPETATGVGNITGVVNNAFATITTDVDATNVAGAAPANTAYIVVTAQNGTTITYTVVYDIGVGIKENNSEFTSLSVVPNPTTGIATVNVLDKASKNITISVVSISGQVISETTINTNGLEVNSTIDLSNQAKGVYFVKVVGKKSIQTKRVITY